MCFLKDMLNASRNKKGHKRDIHIPKNTSFSHVASVYNHVSWILIAFVLDAVETNSQIRNVQRDPQVHGKRRKRNVSATARLEIAA